ncbi:hypothetical protein BDV97DRAFT_345880 [Delphinella strobiligena]|nr:hypothetical protein BDV97DRAFT_345880 [Delphinella strobiligena]
MSSTMILYRYTGATSRILSNASVIIPLILLKRFLPTSVPIVHAVLPCRRAAKELFDERCEGGTRTKRHLAVILMNCTRLDSFRLDSLFFAIHETSDSCSIVLIRLRTVLLFLETILANKVDETKNNGDYDASTSSYYKGEYKDDQEKLDNDDEPRRKLIAIKQ